MTTLTSLEQAVLAACWQAALNATGGDFACLAEVSVPKLGRKALGGVVTSLATKGAISVFETFINQSLTRSGRRTRGTRVVQITFSNAVRASFEEAS